MALSSTTVASPRHRVPLDPTAGELPVGERRALVRSIADTVGQAVAQRAQRAHDAGQAMTAEAEKVGSATEIQRAARRLQRGSRPPRADTVVGGDPRGARRCRDGPRLRARRARRAVGATRRREHRRQRPRSTCSSTFVGGRASCGGRRSRADQEELIDLIRRAARRLGPGRGRVRRPPPAARPAAARRVAAVRRVRRRRRQRVGGTEPMLSIRRHRSSRRRAWTTWSSSACCRPQAASSSSSRRSGPART